VTSARCHPASSVQESERADVIGGIGWPSGRYASFVVMYLGFVLSFRPLDKLWSYWAAIFAEL